MIKYHKKWYSKAFAMFLALTILIAAPFSTVQAYAMEGAQLTESVNPGDTSPDTISEMDGGVPKEAPLETSEAIDSGRPPEESASPTDAAPAGIGLFGDDTTPPAFDGNPIISPQSKGSRQIYILVKAQEEAYFNAVLLPDGANSPTKEQVIAGQDADGNPALRVYKNNKKEIDMHIVGFVPQHGTEYDVYVVLKDDADNTSEPLKVDFKSPDAAEYFVQDFPMNGAVQPDGSKQVEVKIKLENIDSSKKGKVYWVLLPNEARTPSIEQIAQGTDSNNNPAISSGSPEFAPGINDSFLVTGTVGGTDYDLYMVVGNTYYANPLASCTDVVKLDVTTPPDIEGEKLCEIGGTEYATLQEAMEAAGTTATIKLLKSFTTIQGVIIDRKHITFDLNGQTLTIDTTANEGLKVTEGTVALTGEGKLNATGKLYGVWANKGTVTVDTAASGNDGIGVYAMGGSKVTVRGNATGQDNGVYATDSGTMVKVNGNVTSTDGQIQGAAHAQNQAEVIVGGNVSAISGYGARTSNSGVITVEGDVYGLRAGAFTEGAGGSITVKGDLSSYNHCAVITGDSSGNITVEGTVTPKSSASYVLINNVRLEKDAGVSDPGKSGYLKYSGSGATGVVWVKDPLAAKVWEVSDDEGLENALGSFRDGDTIKLMANIDYDKGIAIDGKTVTFDVDGYILNVKNSIENGTGLNVMNGGKVFLTGSGALNVEGYRYGVQVHSNNANSEATVTKATAIGPEGKAAHTNNKAKLTVLGDVTATGNRGIGIHAQQGSLLEVKGNINATNQGVNVSGATAKVTGNVQAISQDPLTGKDIGIGVSVYNGVAEIGGNVTANRVGAMIRAGGSITIDGMITAPAYIEFNDNAPTTIDDYLPETTKVGYRTYSDGKNNVWVKGGEASENVCEIGDVQYATLHEALEEAGSTAIIKLLNSFTTHQSVIINNKDITLDLNGYTLKVDTTADEGLKVTNGTLDLKGEGELNVSGKLYGVWANKGKVTVTNVKALGNDYADGIGVYADEDSKVYVLGDITANIGAQAKGHETQVIIHGKINRSEDADEEKYVIIGRSGMPESWGAFKRINEVIEREFLIYTDIYEKAMVLVKADSSVPERICAMLNFNREEFDFLYSKLEAALGMAIEGWEYEIELLKDIDYTETFDTKGCDWEFNLNGYTLNIITDDDVGLVATSDIRIKGPGEFNVTGKKIGVKAFNEGTYVTVTNATATDEVEGVGIYAAGRVNVSVLGDVSGKAYGIKLKGFENQVLVEGNVYSSNIGIGDVEIGGSTVIVEGSIYADSKRYLELGEVFMLESEGRTDHGFDEMKDYILYADEWLSQINIWVRNAEFYNLTVVNGFGSGRFAEEVWVPIMANIPVGSMFDRWISDGGGEFGDNCETWTGFKMPSNDVTVTAVLDGDTIETYLLTIENGTLENGSGSGTYAAGTEVPILANPAPEGKVFDKWVSEGGGSFKDVNNPNTIFTMPSNPVTITATYKDEPIETYTLTVKGSYAENSGAGKYAPGTKVSIHAGSRNNYSFAGWTTSGQGSFTNANSASTTFIMPNSNTTVTANWKYNSGGGGSTGGGGGYGSSSGGSSTESPTTQTTILPEKKPDQPVTVAALVTVTAEEKGHANTIISHKLITDAINKAQSYAKEQGKTKNGISTELSLTLPKDTGSLGITLTQGALDKLVNTGVKSFKINGYPVTISFDEKALEEINNQREGNVTIEIKPVQDLNTAAEKVIGKRPVYNITISYLKDGKPILISDLNGGIATITIQYKPDKNEAVGYLYGAYVNEMGNANLIDGSAYDINEGEMIISTSYILNHGVGYKEPSSKFIDIENHWAKESIDYVVARALLTGTSETTFAPNMAMTREMLVTALGRLAGVDEKAYDTNSFIDVNVDSPFHPYIEWAYKKDIVKGIGNQRFAPNRAITREEIAVIFVNYAKATGYRLPIIREVTTYADTTNIGSYYQPAVKAMQQAGIMIGDTKNQFNPKKSATRAEVSSMVQRYIKLTQDPETAYGWALNDAGQYLYYKNSKVLTGMQIIDGVKYFFNTDGTLKTSWVKDGNNWRYYSGNTMLVGFWDIGTNGNNKTYYFTKDGIMVAGKWLEIGDKWYYFNADGSLAKGTKINGYEVDENGVRKTK
ncbi:MAG: S-layer homology domain-containing protein [Eubacteriales bacterium]